MHTHAVVRHKHSGVYMCMHTYKLSARDPGDRAHYQIHIPLAAGSSRDGASPSAPMEKWTNNSIAPYIKTHAHMHPRPTGRLVNVGAFAHTRVILLFHRCGLQGQSGFRHFQTFPLGVLALPWLFVPRIKNIHDIQIFPGPGACV